MAKFGQLEANLGVKAFREPTAPLYVIDICQQQTIQWRHQEQSTTRQLYSLS